MFFPPPGGATEYIAYRSVRYMDFAQATISRDIFIPCPTQCGLSRSLTNRQNTQHFTSLKREFALPSTVSWLPSRLSSTWRWKDRIECIFSNSKYAKKAGLFKWKAGKRDGAKKREFTPERSTVDTYGLVLYLQNKFIYFDTIIILFISYTRV